AYVDLGSSCNIIKLDQAERLKLQYDTQKRMMLQGYGEGEVETLGVGRCRIKIDDVELETMVNVVPNFCQDVPVLIGHPFTEQDGIVIVKNNESIRFSKQHLTSSDELNRKIQLCVKRDVTIPVSHIGNMKLELRGADYTGVHGGKYTGRRRTGILHPSDIQGLGCAKSAEMSIRLKKDRVVTYRHYRMAEKEKEIVNQMIGDLLHNEIIRESDSPYVSQIVLVKKKNGEPRMCIDYRKLNSLTVKDHYPLPRIDD
ncbi:uncharacterized protein LOC108916105, partial [Anoplophora glabripennis]|uniref:uncharacterized protein LOC108916105 n=1 Tax=Anoplophora glabripennis TaxID=217634 RepID=UPI0008747DFD